MPKLTFEPGTLDLLYDSEDERFVQLRVAEFNNDCSDARFDCIDLNDGKVVKYLIRDYNILPIGIFPRPCALKILSPEQIANGVKLEEDVVLTGQIIRRD